MLSDLVGSLSTVLFFPVAAAAAQGVSEGGTDDRALALFWIAGLTAAAVIFNQVFQAWGSLTGRFARRIEGDPVVTQLACKEEHKREEQRRENLRLEVKQDVRGIHSRIDDVLAAVAAVRGELRRIGGPEGGPRG
jgi:hypothetical protein